MLKKIFLAIFLCLVGMASDKIPSYRSHDTSRWNTPLEFGTVPLLHSNILYALDKFDGKLKAYAVNGGFNSPELLWQTPGEGNGPGETPKGVVYRNISYDTLTDRVWLIHSLGFHVFNKDGTFHRYIKRPYSESHLIARKDALYMTSPANLKARKAILKVSSEGGKPKWMIPNSIGIPVFEDGGLLNPEPELYSIEETFVYYDSTTGELLAVNKDGDEVLVAYNKMVYYPDEGPVDSIPQLKSGKRFRLYRRLYPRSGVVKKDGSYLCLGLAQGKGIQTASGASMKKDLGSNIGLIRILSRISSQGKLTGRFFHPLLHDNLFLLAIYKGKLVFFEWEEGHQIYVLGMDAFQKVERVIM